MSKSSEFSEQRYKKREAKGLLSNAASILASIHMLNDREPGDQEQDPEVERRRHEDIRQAIRGLASVVNEVVEQIDGFSILEEEYEEIKETIIEEDPPPPSLGGFIRNIYITIIVLREWCEETTMYWENQIIDTARISYDLSKLRNDIAEASPAWAETGGGGGGDLDEVADDVSYPTTPGSGDYLCWDPTGPPPGWVPGAVTEIGGGAAGPLPVGFPITPSDGDYLCWDTGGGEITAGPVTKVGGGAAGPVPISFPITPSGGDYLCWDTGGGEITAGPVTEVDGEGHVYTTPSTGEYICYDGSNFVNTTIGQDDLDDTIISFPTTGDSLRYNGTNWVNDTIELNDLTDVDLTGETTGDVLTFDGTDWTPEAPSSGWTVSQTAPVSPGDGDGWVRSALASGGKIGALYIYNSTDSRWYSTDGFILTMNRNSTATDGDWLGMHRQNALSSSNRALRFAHKMHWYGATIQASNLPGNTMSVTIEINGIDVHTISWDGSNTFISEDDLDLTQDIGDEIRAFVTVGVGTAPDNVHLILEGREYR